VARGHYRILLGMAAGVGKTYRMLQEGRQAREGGRDVVIGYLEPHDRPETIALGIEKVLSRVGAFEGRALVLDLDEQRLCQRLIELYAESAWSRRSQHAG